jgi:periplasmic divalent cation tolerance protein
MTDQSKTEFCVVLITAPSEEVARKIASDLLAKKLAACVNLVPTVSSLYHWKGEIVEDQETLMIVKCRSELFEGEVVAAVRQSHPYEVPEIIALPVVQGAPDYLAWMREVTAGRDRPIHS